MSKERDALKKAISIVNCCYPYTCSEFIKEVKELLAQPEQGHVGIVRTIGGYPDDSEHTVELICRHGDLRDGDLLYTAPQKREPLSDEVGGGKMSYTTWRKEILVRMMDNEDKDINNYVCTLTEEELDIEFYDGFGLPEGLPFTLWTTLYVYFPVVHDGSEWCGSVYRNPTKIPTKHQGGY